jgi:hypothetical protein
VAFRYGDLQIDRCRYDRMNQSDMTVQVTAPSLDIFARLVRNLGFV